ncbi:1,4-alpha-glucan branching protein [Streptomyces gelaticus]|uniref:maltokinase N-terminal cap-like domain-containing protein n=1 Tax=Streptomyces gelaticus TaxID=285446 RepID=UPI0037A4931D
MRPGPPGRTGVVTDTSGDRPATYQVLFGYRGAPIAGADDALIGTTEHGVLGKRWVYDGAHDPVVVAQLFALVAGKTEPQMQSTSDTPDPSVTARLDETGTTAELASFTATDGPDGTDIQVTAAPDGRRLTLHINRVLQPGQNADSQSLGHVTAPAPLPDGTTAPTAFIVVHAHP